MRKRTFVIMAVLLLLVPAALWAWGFRQHRVVNEGAVDILPEPLHGFFALYKDEVTAHAVDPDIWAEEKVLTPPYAHFIDMDLLDNPPFAGIPRTWDNAVARFGEAKLMKAGTLPWEIERRREELTAAFREKRWEDVVKDAAWLGHFIADSTMPLHTTKDYLGKAAGNIVLEGRGPNRSAHHRIEWGLTECFPERYDRVRGRPENVKYIDDVLGETWSTLRQSYACIPQVLAADKRAAEEDESFGKTFYDELEQRIRPFVRNQLGLSQELVASVWLSAWEDAGRPELPAQRIEVRWPAVGADVGASARRSPGPLPVVIALAIIILIVVVVLRSGRRFRRR